MVFDKVRVIVLGGRIWRSSNCLSTAASINPNEEDDHKDHFQIISRSFPIYNLFDCSVIYH